MRSMSTWIVVGLLIACLSACKSDVKYYCDDETPCLPKYPDRPFCDLTGEYEPNGVSNTCVANPFDAGGPDAGQADAGLPGDGGEDCTPSSTTCADGTLTVCDASGHVETSDACPLGCHPNGTRCNDLDPSNGLAGALDQASGLSAVTIPDGATIDTDTGIVTSGSGQVSVANTLISAPTNGVDIRVFRAGSFTIGDVTVSGTAAVAFVSDGDIDIVGDLVLSTASAPGQVWACHATTVNIASDDQVGAGGGGFGTAGASGGNWGTSGGRPGSGAAGGAALVPLRGGCPGGSVVSDPGGILVQYAVGGLGGGAIQLVSRTRIVIGDASGTPRGSIEANGGGAALGTIIPQGGAGGGSGGGILLEAPVVEIETGSGLSANGGTGTCSTSDGSDGTFGSASAIGPTCSGVVGGNGGSVMAAPTRGGNVAADSSLWGGGGGGAVGRIRFNTADGTFVSNGTTVVSPSASTGTVGTR